MNGDCVMHLARLIVRSASPDLCGPGEPAWPGGGPDSPTVSLVWAQSACPEWECPVLGTHPRPGGRTVYLRLTAIYRDGHHLVVTGVEVEGTDYDVERGMWSAVSLA
jgi:hypothetical protein